MRSGILPAILITIFMVITAAGCQPAAGSTEALEAEIVSLQQGNQSLQAQISNLEAERDSLQQQLAEAETVDFQPKAGWGQYFPLPDQTTLKGETVEAVRDLLGNPPIMMRSLSVEPQYNREIWIFHVQDEDQTALFLRFRGGKLWSSNLDEFNGLENAGSFFDDEDLWN